jgi:hypothetical protein
MQQYRLLQIAVMACVLCSVMCMVRTVAAPAFESQVEATMTCTFITGSQLRVHVQMIVNRINNIYDTSYDRQTIESIATSDLEVMGIIKQRLRDFAKDQLETAFMNSEISAVDRPTYTNPFFIDDFRVNLTTSFFQYNRSLNLTNFINGMLDMGANVTYQFHLKAEDGWNTTYAYIIPNTMMLAYANTQNTNLESNTITWDIRNWDGLNTGTDAMLSIRAKNPTIPASELNDISLEFTLDTRTVNSIGFTNTFVVKRLNIVSYSVIPAFITGITAIPADGVRLCIDSGLFSWQDLFEKTLQPMERQISPIIENSSFHQPLNSSFSWDEISTTNCSTPFNVTHMDDQPALRANFNDADVDLQICQLPAKAFFGLLNSGASATISADDVNFGSGLNNLPYPYTILLRLPINITLNGNNVYTWNKSIPLGGSFHSGLQPNPPYAQEHTEMYVEIELAKMDLNIPSIFTGKTELTATAKLKEDDRLYVIRRSTDLALPQKIMLSFLNSDVLRLCIEDHVFNDSEMSMFLSEKTEEFQQRLSVILHGLHVKGTLDKKVFSNSLLWDGDISAMDDVIPVVVSNTANQAYTVLFNVSLWPVDLAFTPQTFALRGIENQTVTYRIIFPQGITVNASTDTGKSMITGKTNDGHDFVELSFDPESAQQLTVLTCVLNASPVYVIWIFLPCLLVFVLLIVLVVIIYLIRKKRGGLRRGKRKLFEPEDNEPADYSGEDYYVPPPPSSKKKK